MKNKIKILINIELDSLMAILLSLMAVLGSFEMTYRNPYNLVLVPVSNISYVRQIPRQDPNNPVTRERDEVDTQYISYSESQRTFPRAAKY